VNQESISVSRLTTKYQATVPRLVRERLGVGAGDSIAFVVEADRVSVRRAEPLDREYARALSGTMSEWLSPADEQAYRDL
jgi:bifunctional DNA-binding transcriptional regulator/antitoxin component of YhaV-PrlF toxin-antitoxin module